VLAGGPTIDVREAVLNVARWLQWVRETDGPNRGEVVDQLLATVHLTPGNPWCAAFVAASGRAVLGRTWPLPLVGGVMTLRDYAARHGILHRHPQPGAVFLQWHARKGRYAHTGFVVGQVRDQWTTIEGNTDGDEGGRDGDGVYLLNRSWGELDRFIPWWVLLGPTTTAVA
jgi:hypothetical protein